MPIYEYRCSSCGHQQEFMLKLSDAPLTTCTKCNKPTFTKMLTAAGFQLKGSGWYATDFKSKGTAPAAKEGTAPAAKEGADSGEKKGADSGEKKGADSGEKKGDTGGDAKASASGAGACPACT
jgi:putative FmdB family regulatory protein